MSKYGITNGKEKNNIIKVIKFHPNAKCQLPSA